jgi:hypothetical protein
MTVPCGLTASPARDRYAQNAIGQPIRIILFALPMDNSSCDD